MSFDDAYWSVMTELSAMVNVELRPPGTPIRVGGEFDVQVVVTNNTPLVLERVVMEAIPTRFCEIVPGPSGPPWVLAKYLAKGATITTGVRLRAVAAIERPKPARLSGSVTSAGIAPIEITGGIEQLTNVTVEAWVHLPVFLAPSKTAYADIVP